MKQSPNMNPSSIEILAILGLLFSQTIIWAQDKTVDVNLSVGQADNNWYLQPWVWIVAAAVFILILVALLRSKK